MDSRRIPTIDIVRGLVMVLMAIDHVRVYAGVPAGGPDAGVFFTRWVTHFCAPVFAFLAGTSVYLSARSGGSVAARGLTLVVLEVTLIKFFWTSRLDYSFTLAGVIWMLGWCMVLLAPMVRWMRPVHVGWTGIAIVLLQQLFGLLPQWIGLPPIPFGAFWEFLYPAGFESVPGVAVLYVIVPWVGVMAAGFGFGALLRHSAEGAARRSRLIRIGLCLTFAFLVVGIVVTAGNRNLKMPFLWQLLNQQKYPASQLFILMTLGPAILLMGLLEGRGKSALSGFLAVFGRAPMLYYLLHIPLIHGAALVTNQILFGAMHDEFYANAPFARVPEEFRWSLPLLYLVFAVVVALLFVPCRWFDRMKAERRVPRWLSLVL